MSGLGGHGSHGTLIGRTVRSSPALVLVDLLAETRERVYLDDDFPGSFYIIEKRLACQ